METVTEALQFWYERQEKGKVAFRFKSFMEGKTVRDAPSRKKIQVHSIGKGKKLVRSKGGRKGQADTKSATKESRSDNPAAPQLNDQVHSGKGKKPVRSKGRVETDSGSDESESDDEAGPSKKSVAKSADIKNTKRTLHDRTQSDSNGSISSGDEAELTVTEATMKPPSPMKDTDSYWEADLGGSASTDVMDMELGARGKRKRTDDDATPVKKPRVKIYKLGPRNAQPGKIKQALAFSPVVQGPVTKAEQQKPILEVSIGKFHKQSTIGGLASQAGPSQLTIPSLNFDFTESGDGNPVKPKPKPRPIIKGKVSSSELGIVTRDRSKRIAQESVRSTRSKKLITT